MNPEEGNQSPTAKLQPADDIIEQIYSASVQGLHRSTDKKLISKHESTPQKVVNLEAKE